VQGVLFDITQRVYNEMAIKHEADHDPLTGLLRRQAAKTEFEAYLAANKDAKATLFLMDLDGFKQANDTYGHAAGDHVLTITAERLLRCVRSTDIVCRLGGDEFLVILFGWEHHQVKFKIADNIIQSLDNKIDIDGKEIMIGVSIGIVDYIAGKHDFSQLLQDADAAMYEVKRNGKNGYCYRDGLHSVLSLSQRKSA
jgi:diguanylate cyclase (GGDEF)-like protein